MTFGVEYSDEIVETLLDQEKALKNFKKTIDLLEKTDINLNDQKEFYRKSSTNKLLDKFKEEYK